MALTTRRSHMLLQISLAMVLLPVACNGSGGGSNSNPIALPGCPDRCGDVTIPFPFGTKSGCYLDKGYLITCNETSGCYLDKGYLITCNKTAFFGKSDIPVINISVADGQLKIMKRIYKVCYDQNGTQVSEEVSDFTSGSGFTISAKMNKFTAVGCDTIANIYASQENKRRKFTGGCVSYCDGEGDVDYGSCSGVGCCQTTSFRSRLDKLQISFDSYYNHKYVWGFNPCSYAFVAEDGKFNFSKSSFEELNKTERLPMVLDWAIGNESCTEAARRKDKYACQGNSECVGSNTGSGYLCQCKRGYQGNPYHPDGCQDIDECKDLKPCKSNEVCQNLPGTHNCTCGVDYKLTNGSVCTKIQSSGGSHDFIAFISVGVGFIALFGATVAICWGVNERKSVKSKAKFFQQNGGLMLKQQLANQRGTSETTKIFTIEDLKKATNNFHESRILGEGGYGTVYKGELSDKTEVAVKKSKVGAQTQTSQFINELVVLTQINHMNVVKLLGCCLETQVPLLVYELVPNDTLFSHIHRRGQAILPLSWELRLKIAAETAGALAYLHVDIVPPIIHRDVKTTNILLDENNMAKVSDFGISRLIPQDKDGLTTMVQGTLGYLDPEYFHTSLLTEKSDVYSFGVVLAELVTGKKALCFDRPEGEKCLAKLFVSSLDDHRLHHIIDATILHHENMETIKKVADIVKRCLSVNGEERPSMREVAIELEQLTNIVMKKHPWEKVEFVSEENENLLGDVGEASGPHCIDIESSSSTGITSVGYDSMQSQILMPYHDAR